MGSNEKTCKDEKQHVMDWLREEEIKQAWLNRHNDQEMNLDTFAQIVKQGFNLCGCIEEDLCDKGACSCVRSVFPTPSHYELYKYLREHYIAHTLERAILSRRLEESNDTNRTTKEG